MFCHNTQNSALTALKLPFHAESELPWQAVWKMPPVWLTVHSPFFPPSHLMRISPTPLKSQIDKKIREKTWLPSLQRKGNTSEQIHHTRKSWKYGAHVTRNHHTTVTMTAHVCVPLFKSICNPGLDRCQFFIIFLEGGCWGLGCRYWKGWWCLLWIKESYSIVL